MWLFPPGDESESSRRHEGSSSKNKLAALLLQAIRRQLDRVLQEWGHDLDSKTRSGEGDMILPSLQIRFLLSLVPLLWRGGFSAAGFSESTISAAPVGFGANGATFETLQRLVREVVVPLAMVRVKSGHDESATCNKQCVRTERAGGLQHDDHPEQFLHDDQHPQQDEAAPHDDESTPLRPGEWYSQQQGLHAYATRPKAAGVVVAAFCLLAYAFTNDKLADKLAPEFLQILRSSPAAALDEHESSSLAVGGPLYAVGGQEDSAGNQNLATIFLRRSAAASGRSSPVIGAAAAGLLLDDEGDSRPSTGFDHGRFDYQGRGYGLVAGAVIPRILAQYHEGAASAAAEKERRFRPVQVLVRCIVQLWWEALIEISKEGTVSEEEQAPAEQEMLSTSGPDRLSSATSSRDDHLRSGTIPTKSSATQQNGSFEQNRFSRTARSRRNLLSRAVEYTRALLVREAHFVQRTRTLNWEESDVDDDEGPPFVLETVLEHADVLRFFGEQMRLMLMKRALAEELQQGSALQFSFSYLLILTLFGRPWALAHRERGRENLGTERWGDVREAAHYSLGVLHML